MNFIANAQEPKVTKDDLLKLDKARDAEGMVGDPKGMVSANELYVAGKKLFDAQNKLIKAGGESKNPEMAEEVANLELEYQDIRAKQRKPMPAPSEKNIPISPEILEQEQKREKIEQDENGDYVRVIEEGRRKKRKPVRIVVPQAQVKVPTNWRSIILNEALSQ